MKILIVILLFSGIVFSQVSVEKHQAVKILIADYAIQLDKIVKLNMDLTESINTLVAELQAIEEPSDELIALLKKYGLYKEK